MRAPVVAATFFSLLLLAATNAWSVEDKEDGQEDLDRAIETKLAAHSIRELNSVISLSESALDKGLSEKNQAFAKQLLAAALVDRGSAICEMIFGRGAPRRNGRRCGRSAWRIWSVRCSSIRRSPKHICWWPGCKLCPVAIANAR